MAAPFELPDLADLYEGATSGVPYATEVACRQVPIFKTMKPGFSGNTTYSGPTHWVDFEPEVYLPDGMEPYQGGAGQYLGVGGAMIRIDVGDATIDLQVLFVEDRYTNTDNHYLRAYCGRIVRNT